MVNKEAIPNIKNDAFRVELERKVTHKVSVARVNRAFGYFAEIESIML